MTWLITGGAGYIGSHVAKLFSDSGKSVVIVDSLVHGDKFRVSSDVQLEQFDIRDRDQLERVIRKNHVKGIVHLAALKSIDEGQKNPALYRDVNIQGTISVLDAAINLSVEKIIFSSSAAVYGNSKVVKVSESEISSPESIYGETKAEAEAAVTKKLESKQILGTSLRYFNVAGRANETLGDRGLTNLLPIALDSIRKGIAPVIYGSDYPTSDGSCIRDYVHVMDIAQAHLASADAAFELPSVMNVGTGHGHSVKEVIEILLRKTGSNLVPIISDRREGDIAALVANPALFEKTLGLAFTKSIDEIIESLI